MKLLLLIGTGSFLGGALRFLVSQWMQNRFLGSFPFGTLTVNVVGCFIIGIVMAASDRSSMSADWRIFLATGMCGGFTTFSAFSYDTILLLRAGQYLSASGYIMASVLLSILATIAGYYFAKLM